MTTTLDEIRRLPKTDLHCHLDGSMRPDTVIDLARTHGVTLPAANRDELLRVLVAGEGVASLEDYLRAFDVTVGVLQWADALARAAYELAEDAAREHVRYLEVRYCPLLHVREGLAPAETVEAVLRGLARARRELGIRSGVILCAMRTMGADAAVTVAELCVAFKRRGVVALDLAGAEADYPAKRYRDAYALVAANNVNCTAHAGESFGAASIHQAIHLIGAQRIGHGTRLVEDADLLDYVTDRRIPLEICPTSNLQTRVAPTWSAHPLEFYRAYGVVVTINTDNRLMSNTTVSDELFGCVHTFGWPRADLDAVILAGFEAAFLPYRARQELIASVRAELAALTAQEGHADPIRR